MELNRIIETYLHDQGRLRVWSLIVTVLGDMAAPRKAAMPTARLGVLLDAMGVGRPAQKTALSRLVKDGLALREKTGRTSAYRFSEATWAETIKVEPLIYADPEIAEPQDWVIAQSDAPRGLRLTGGFGLWLADQAPQDLGFALKGEIITGNLPPAVIGQDHQTEALALTQLCHGLEGFEGTSLEHAVARVVLIHRWRRYVLRFPKVPQMLAEQDFAGTELPAKVARIYAALSDGSDVWLGEAGEGYGPMPPKPATAQTRFGL